MGRVPSNRDPAMSPMTAPQIGAASAHLRLLPISVADLALSHTSRAGSLCKLGFPLHRIVPVYDEKANTFTLPEGSVPLPLFPMEGMFTRVVNTRAPGSEDGEPSAFIETSTPSLIGQMGGPVFGGEAVVWGIQSHTMHHALGFRPPVPDGAAGQVEHQFLNTGLAVHAAVTPRRLGPARSSLFDSPVHFPLYRT